MTTMTTHDEEAHPQFPHEYKQAKISFFPTLLMLCCVMAFSYFFIVMTILVQESPSDY